MASKVLASHSTCSDLEVGDKSVDIWKTRDVKCEFFLQEGVIFRISLLQHIALHHPNFASTKVRGRPQLTGF